MTEAWEGRKGERTTQAGYKVYSKPNSQLVLYVREKVDLVALGKVQIGDMSILVGSLVTGIYLSPSLTINTLRQLLQDIPMSDNIIGDFNCTQRHKRRTLLQTATH